MAKVPNGARLTEALAGYDPKDWTVEPVAFAPFVVHDDPTNALVPRTVAYQGILVTVRRQVAAGYDPKVVQVVLGHEGRFYGAHGWDDYRFTAEEVNRHLAQGYEAAPWYIHSSHRLTLTKALDAIKEFAPGEVERRKAEEAERDRASRAEARVRAWEHYDAAVFRHGLSMRAWMQERDQWVRWTSARMQSLGAPGDLADRVAGDMASGAFWQGAPDGVGRAGVREQPPMARVPSFPRPVDGVTPASALLDEADRYRVNVFKDAPWWVWEVIDNGDQGRVVAGSTVATEAEAEALAINAVKAVLAGQQHLTTRVFQVPSTGGWVWQVVDSAGTFLAGGREVTREAASVCAVLWEQKYRGVTTP